MPSACGVSCRRRSSRGEPASQQNGANHGTGPKRQLPLGPDEDGEDPDVQCDRDRWYDWMSRHGEGSLEVWLRGSQLEVAHEHHRIDGDRYGHHESYQQLEGAR